MASTADPGPQFEINVTWSEDNKEQEKIYHERQKIDWDNEANIRCTSIDALNKVVHKEYRRGTGTRLGTRVYRTTGKPRDIINELHESP